MGVLVLVHEFGHFLTAKKAGVYVEEFGIGYPPRALTLGKKWGTKFSLNWIPFGGFVKILGENYDKEVEKPESLELKALNKESKDFSKAPSSKLQTLRFTQVSRKWQALILAGGVIFNIVFAWILLTFGFVIGVPTPVDNDFGGTVRDPNLTVVSVLKDSPAQKVGIKTGDKILSVSIDGELPLKPSTPEMMSEFVESSINYVSLQIERGDEEIEYRVVPEKLLDEDTKIIGIGMDMVGTMTLPVHKAIYQGGKVTISLTYLITEGLLGLLKDAVRGEADTSQITGPVGIVGLVGDASKLGFSYLLTFTALISINLAIINMIPFPALDGGRLLFVAIESITKKPINPKFAMIVNTVGFGMLILLMLVVTYRDIAKLF